MDVKYGLMSCDSHAQLGRDAFTSRMSEARWGDLIPRVVEVEEEGELVHRWSVNGRVQAGAVVNCPALMHEQRYYPKRWEEVPEKAYVPAKRLAALDEDRVDAEVLFPNTPVQGGSFGIADAALELACVEAYNDAMAEYAQVSERYIPLALIPYLSPIEAVNSQVERALKRGHRGILMVAAPDKIKGVKPVTDRYWDPLWGTCQELGMPINWHASSGVGIGLPRWSGYSEREAHAASTGHNYMGPAQVLPALLFTGVFDRFPRLNWVLAETGAGWLPHLLERCDHEWERLHLWTEGVQTRPSDVFRRQVHVDFWFERSGMELRHIIGVDRIMWESDLPHITTTYPNSWEYVERSVEGLPQEDREKLLYRNLMRVYNLS
ncbi:MAG TPA: amidohydrolase family protein [Chloroflexota bacterium]|nr:amidohydrolase family protein [Chloroflexota bacterium]